MTKLASPKKGLKMQIHAEGQTHSLKPIPNPRGTQTVPQPKPTTPRSPDGRFAPEFHPHPRRPNRRSNAVGANDSRQERSQGSTCCLFIT